MSKDFRIVAIYIDCGADGYGGYDRMEEIIVDEKCEIEPEAYELQNGDGETIATLCDFEDLKYIRDRLNALANIPKKWFPDVKRMVVAWKVIYEGWTGITLYRDFGIHLHGFHRGQSDDEYEEICGMNAEEVIKTANKILEAGGSFGTELDQLIRECK